MVCGGVVGVVLGAGSARRGDTASGSLHELRLDDPGPVAVRSHGRAARSRCLDGAEEQWVVCLAPPGEEPLEVGLDEMCWLYSVMSLGVFLSES